MPSAIYQLFRSAIAAEQQVVCNYQGHRREVCPHIIGTNKDGAEVVLAWQFGGTSSQGKLPPGGQWRCLLLRNVTHATARDGDWRSGGDHRTTQTCVAHIDIDVNVHIRRAR